jgi:hypothetical protein
LASTRPLLLKQILLLTPCTPAQVRAMLPDRVVLRLAKGGVYVESFDNVT